MGIPDPVPLCAGIIGQPRGLLRYCLVAARSVLAHVVLPALVVAAIPGFALRAHAGETGPDFLTAGERAWLNSHATELCVAPEANYPPFSFGEAGAWQGVSADLFRLVEAKLGAKFSILPPENLEAILARAQHGAPGIVTSVRETPERSPFLSFTRPYVSIPTVLIVRTDSRLGGWPQAFAGRRVAVGKGYGVQAFLEQSHPGLTLIPVADDLEGLRRLAFGSVDAVIMDNASATFFVKQEKIYNLRICCTLDYRYDLGLAVCKELPVLRDILDKTLRTIGEAELQALVSRWIHLETGEAASAGTHRHVLTFGLPLLIILLGVGTLSWIIAVRRKVAKRHLAWALGALAAGLLFTGMVTSYAKTDAERAARRTAAFTSGEVQHHIVARLRACGQVLRSGASLFDATGLVSREQWRVFTQGLQLEQQLPGIQGVGFAQLVPRAQLAEHVQAIRREGYPGYEVWPAGDRETYTSIIYLEPFTNRNLRAFGYDMLSEPVRRAAMERARDDNSMALSGKVTLVQETSRGVQPGTLLYFPVYRRGMPLDTVPQRRAAIIGWVYSPYRMTDLLEGSLNGWHASLSDRQVALEVYDGGTASAKTLLYANQAEGGGRREADDDLRWETAVDFAGRRWTLRFTQAGGLAAMADYSLAWTTGLAGTMISLLLFGLTLSLLSTRADAQRIAAQLTEALQQSRDMLNFIIEGTTDAVYSKDTLGRYLVFNPAASRFVGKPPEEVLGQDDRALFPLEEALRVMEGDRGAMAASAPRTYEERVTTADGVITTFLSTKGPLRDTRGKVIGLFGIARDITGRKRAEEMLRLSLAEKTTLLKEVHHRVKNNLQVVASLLSLQAGRARGQAEQELLVNTQNRVRSMALIHEALYQSESLSRLDLAEYLRGLCTHLMGAGGPVHSRVTLECEVGNRPLTVKLDQAVPCGLLVNELVSNALKHAFPGERSGRIQLMLEHPTPDEVLLTVADDGVGLPVELDPRRVDSLGLRLVFLLTEQLRGTVSFTTNPGTAVLVRFPSPAETEANHEQA